MNKIYVIGVGPGDKDYLLNIAEEKAASADVLIGGSRALEIFEDQEKEKFEITGDLSRVRNYVEDNYRNKKIAILVSGDPGLYSLLGYLRRYFPPEDLEVIPGVSAMQLAFARVSTSWQDAKIVSLHGNQGKEKLGELLELVRENTKVGVFTDRESSPDTIAGYLTEKGIRNRTGVVFTELSYDSEESFSGSLEQIAGRDFKSLNFMVILDERMEV